MGQLLKKKGYSLQANRKMREGKQHPDRNAQFEHINRRVLACQRRGQPAVSVDTKKKEVLGNRKNAGRTYRPKGKPGEVDMHDFPDDKLGKAIPYGVYDLQRNEAWVSVGIDHDTAAFAVASIEQWWKRMGRKRYGNARRLLITGDSGGSNGHRNRLEDGTSKACGSDRLDFGGLSFSARHEQVEQDRTSVVLPHNAQLARRSFGDA